MTNTKRVVVNFPLSDDDRLVVEYLKRRTGITSSSQLVRLCLREAADKRGWLGGAMGGDARGKAG